MKNIFHKFFISYLEHVNIRELVNTIITQTFILKETEFKP